MVSSGSTRPAGCSEIGRAPSSEDGEFGERSVTTSGASMGQAETGYVVGVGPRHPHDAARVHALGEPVQIGRQFRTELGVEAFSQLDASFSRTSRDRKPIREASGSGSGLRSEE